MINIRQSVFETNSSSTHSISIVANTDGIYDTIAVDDEGVLHLTGGQFGWEEVTYTDALTKANYCAVDVMDRSEMAECIEMLIKVLREHTGAKSVAFEFSLDWKSDNYSYIDHQSAGTSHEAFANEQTLKDFIFNPKSILRTDNDNHYEDDYHDSDYGDSDYSDNGDESTP